MASDRSADDAAGSAKADSHPLSWAEFAAGPASARSVGALVDTPPAALSKAELVDAIVASEKAMSLLAASQMRLLTEFATPGRAGDVSGLVETLLDKGGIGRRSDGTLDLDAVESIVTDRAQSLAATEVSAALRISPITAGVRVRKAVELCEQLPDTVQALATGRIDRGRAFLIAERTAVLCPQLRAKVQDRVLPLAENRSTGNLRGLVDRAVIAADPAAAEERERKAKRDRELTLLPLPDGMASVKAFAPAAGAVSIYAVADLLAGRSGADDDRPVGARRVDAWVDIAEQLLTYGRVDLTGLLDDPDDPTEPDEPAEDRPDGTGPLVVSMSTDLAGTEPAMDSKVNAEEPGSDRPATAAPDATTTKASCSCGMSRYPLPENPAALPVPTRWASRRSRLPHLVITMSASTWAGLDRLPAHLDGYGAVTAETALALARSAKSITAALLDPASGSVLGVGDRVYRPRQAVRDAVSTAAETCRFPSCRQPAWRCDLDHRDAFDHGHPDRGGRTCELNLDPLCRAHHLMKHQTGWSSAPSDGYGREWVSPTGHRYLDPARSFTLPAEQLTPTDAIAESGGKSVLPSASRLRRAEDFDSPDCDSPLPDRDDRRDDDFDPQSPDRADWRDAELGGAFPDTPRLKVITAIARRRLQALRESRPPARPRPPTPASSCRPDRVPPRRSPTEPSQPEATRHSDDPPF